MNPFGILFDEIVYRPIFNTLVLLLQLFQGNLGFAVIGLTLLVKFLLLKPTLAGNNMQKGMGNIQPRLKEIQEQYKDDPEKMSAESMKLLKESGGGQMLKGCIMMLIQIPVFLGLFFVVKDFSTIVDGVRHIRFDALYSFFDSFKNILTGFNPNFFGLDVLKPNTVFAILGSVLIGLQTFLTQAVSPKPAANPMLGSAMPDSAMPDMSKMMQFMNIFLVFMTFTFLNSMPLAVALYTVVSTLFSLVQFVMQQKEILKVKWYAFTHKKA